VLPIVNEQEVYSIKSVHLLGGFPSRKKSLQLPAPIRTRATSPLECFFLPIDSIDGLLPLRTGANAYSDLSFEPNVGLIRRIDNWK